MKRSWCHPQIDAKGLQDLDLQIAVEIAGHAGMDVRDRRGNLSPDVWARHSDKMSVGNLIEASDIRQLLMDQLKTQLDQQKELVKQLEDDGVVVKWVLKFVDTWETAYQAKVNQNFDISQKILTAMDDTMTELKYTLVDIGVDWKKILQKVDDLITTEDCTLPVHQALTRFTFRNEITGPYVRRLAGKILQKNIVCNKAGTYSAKVQRNDVTQEKSNALTDTIIFFTDERQTILDIYNNIDDDKCRLLLNSSMIANNFSMETIPSSSYN